MGLYKTWHWCIIVMPHHQFRNSHCWGKMLQPSYLSYNGNITSLYWIKAQGPAFVNFADELHVHAALKLLITYCLWYGQWHLRLACQVPFAIGWINTYRGNVEGNHDMCAIWTTPFYLLHPLWPENTLMYSVFLYLDRHCFRYGLHEVSEYNIFVRNWCNTINIESALVDIGGLEL